jgi:RNA polymerase sigma-70 factor (ECF subfamily)
VDFFAGEFPPAATIHSSAGAFVGGKSRGGSRRGVLAKGNALVDAVDWSLELSRHGRWLRTVVRSRLGDGQHVDDVLQEVAVAAVGSAALPADPAKVPAWLYQVAVRQALLMRRRLCRQRRLADRYVERRRPALERGGAADPLAWLLLEERDQALRRALAALDDEDREVLILKHTENWSYRDLAERLGISRGAVEHRLFKARRALREALRSGSGKEVCGDGREDTR